MFKLTIKQASDKLKNKEISSVELTEAVLGRLETVEPQIKAFLHIDAKGAIARAGQADKRLADGGGPPLLGVPVAVKDNICEMGMPCTCASKILGDFRPPYNATVIEALRRNGAVTVGKTNLDEFAMGSSTENSSKQTTRNPWDTGRVPGGSSGGSAASVAADQAIAALGSDTGGSIRQPASFCGIVGLKPTYGLVSRYGLVAFASSLDQIGPLTKDVADAAILLQAITGHDPADSTSLDYQPPDYTAALDREIRGIKFGLPKELFGAGIQPDVRAVIKQTITLIESLGGEVGEVSLPTLEYALPAYYIIAPAEASSNLARFDGVRYGRRAEGPTDMIDSYMKTRAQGFGPEVKRRIMIGTYALSAGYYDAYYGQAQKVRTLIIRDFKKAFDEFDVLISPTTPTTAFSVGDKTADPLEMYLSDICTIPTNMAGIPAISIPAGLADGLPVGLQIMGKHFDESTILGVASALEREIGFERKNLLSASGH